MKEAKSEFDRLVEKIQRGEIVQFGQMETLFARALLGRFLEQLRSNAFREQAEQVHKERLLAEDHPVDEEELPTLSERELIVYELDQARTAIGALGVRPTIRQMRPYVETALRERDWRLLNTTVSLTDEGRLEKGTLERIILDSLLTTPTRSEEDTTNTIKAEFGEPQYTRDIVDPIYARALAEGNIKGTKAVHDETHIAIQSSTVQIAYEMFAGQGHSEPMNQLVRITGRAPVKTAILKTNLAALAEKQVIEEETLREFDTLLDIRTDAPLAKKLQLAALHGENVRTFFKLYRYVDKKARVAAANVHKAYQQLATAGNLDHLVHEAIQIGIAPQPEILTKAYSYLFQEEDLERIKKLAEETRTTPQLDEAVVDAKLRFVLEERRTMDSLEHFTRLAQVVQQAGKTLAQEHVERACKRYLSGELSNVGLKGRIQLVDTLHTTLGVEPSETITALKLERRIRELEAVLEELEREYTLPQGAWSQGAWRKKSPLAPEKGINISEYRRYSSEARKAVREHVKDLKIIRQAHPTCSLDERLQTDQVDAWSIRRTMERCLETFLLQCLMNGKPIALQQLLDAVDMSLDESTVTAVLSNHIIRNYEKAEQAETIFARAEAAGVKIALSDEQIRYIGTGIKARMAEHGVFARGMIYLSKLIGKRPLPTELQEVLQAESIDELSRGQIYNYDKLQSVLTIAKRPLTPEETTAIRNRVITILTSPSGWGRNEKERRDDSEAIITRANVTLSAAPEELEAIVNGYFSSRKDMCAENPALIAETFNAALNPEQIQRRYRSLLTDNELAKERKFYSLERKLEAVNALYRDTKITAGQELMKEFIDAMDDIDKGPLVRGLVKIFGFQHEATELQQIYRREVARSRDDAKQASRWRYVRALLETHEVAPEQNIATAMYEASVKSLENMDDRAYFERRGSSEEEHLPSIVKRLRQFNIPIEESLVARVKKNGLERPGILNARLIDCIYRLHNDYQRADSLSSEEAMKVADAIDADFNGEKNSHHTRSGTSIMDLSFIYERAGRKARANEIATRLFREQARNRFPLYAYCAITGAQPNIETPELITMEKDHLEGSQKQYYFLSEQSERFRRMINKWKGEKE